MAGKSLERDADVEVQVANIVQHGDKLIVPKKMSFAGAIDLLKRRMQYEQETVNLMETFDAFPWDGAHALDQVLVNMFGWAPSVTKPGGFFRPPEPPALVAIEVAFGKVVNVPWGRFNIPTVDGYIECDTNRKDNLIRFQITAVVKRKDESTVKALFKNVRDYLATNSIYRGKAIKLRFRQDNGDALQMPEPKFMNTDSINPSCLIYSHEVQRSIETNLFTPIRRIRDCIANNIPVKRGVMLGGPYGTGKTLAAFVDRKYAVEAGLTFIYVQRADELDDAISFAKLYGNPAAVLFCEDIDRSLKGERTVKIDDILNTIDGIDSKSLNLITVLTSNHLEDINPAMLRPGRLDAIIEVLPPDAEAAERLIRFYGGDAIDADTDLTEAGQRLAGTIPAIIAEVVKRAKLSQLSQQAEGTLVRKLTSDALADAAYTMKTQQELLDRASRPKEKPADIDTALRGIVNDALSGQAPQRMKGRLDGGGNIDLREDRKVTAAPTA